MPWKCRFGVKAEKFINSQEEQVEMVETWSDFNYKSESESRDLSEKVLSTMQMIRKGKYVQDDTLGKMA